jgi:ribosomal protein L31
VIVVFVVTGIIFNSDLVNVMVDITSESHFNFVITDFGSASLVNDTNRVSSLKHKLKMRLSNGFLVRYTAPEVSDLIFPN